jgi:rhamnogalacturonyl hydrolase YesR
MLGALGFGLVTAPSHHHHHHHPPPPCLLQVLDVPSTFLETSASAMFLFAAATGVNEGWLPQSKYGPSIDLAWTGLTRAVNANGTVSGICAGTPIEPDVAAYEARPTDYAESQSGLGAVFRAALAVHAYQGGQWKAGGLPA